MKEEIRLGADEVAAWTRNLDPELALWNKTNDSTGKPSELPPERTFEVRKQADFLLAAAEKGVLRKLPVQGCLQSLLNAQDQASGKAGIFRWHYHDPAATDTNAAFFTTLPLLTLRIEHAQTLTAAERGLCDEMLANSRNWFAKKSAQRGFHYPNAYIGDVVCHYLIEEHLAGDLREPVALLEEAAIYYRNQAWGWGEHMSDNYAKVCEYAISCLLFLESKLTPGTRELWNARLRELVSIDLLFADGPRVPTIRSYAIDRLATQAELEPLNKRLGPVTEFPLEDYGRGLMAFLWRKGWLDKVADVQPAELPIPCYGGSQAHAHLKKRWRMGVMSRYPIMEGLDDNPKWGLAWQSMPFALSSEGDDWGFLQWEVHDRDVVTAHPALHRWDSVKSLGLEPNVGKGETFGLPWQSGFLILRRISHVPAAWNLAVDRLRLRRGRGTTLQQGGHPGTFAISLGAADQTLYVNYLPLRGAPGAGTLNPAEEWATLDFQIDLKAGPGYAALWWFGETPLQINAQEPEGNSVRISAGEDFLDIKLDASEPFA